MWAGGQHAGFAGASTSKNKQRAINRQHSIALFVVEAFQINRFRLLHGTRSNAARLRGRGG
jgi:hypothetical protein